MTHKVLKTAGLLAALATVSACGQGFSGALIEVDARGPDKTLDRSRDVKDLALLTAGIWIDPNGCDHWIIDDGIEGYLSQRVDPYGKPVCTGHGAETVATGPFKEGSTVNVEVSEQF
ncbi:MAG: hypothetical protein AAF092_08125 [Pseudomonadota bacterium]